MIRSLTTRARSKGQFVRIEMGDSSSTSETIELFRTLRGEFSNVAFATHDELLVWEAFRLAEEMSLPKDAYEFQVLLGVQAELRDIIRDAGHRMRVYIPYGKDWYSCSVRRLRENPEIAGYVMRAMLRGE